MALQTFSVDGSFHGGAAHDTSTFVVDSVGNKVGIGTESPGYKLHVQDSDSYSVPVRIQSKSSTTGTSTSAYIDLLDGTGHGGYIEGLHDANVTHGLRLGTWTGGGRDSAKMIIKSNGNVGIGTADPVVPLDVHGANIQSSANGTVSTAARFGSSDGTLHVSSVKTSNGAETLALQTTIDQKTMDYNITNGWNYGSVVRHALCLQPYKGYVGIGTASPLSPLDIKAVKGITTSAATSDLLSNATIRISGYAENHDALCIGMLGTDTSGDSGNNPYAYIQNIWDTNKTARPLLLNPAGGNVGIGTTNPLGNLHVRGENMYFSSALVSNCTWRIMPQTGNSTKLFRIYDQDNGADRLVINASGKVGIGTVNPMNKLDVRSDNYATFGKATYNAAGWSGIRLGTPYTTNHDAYCSVIESYNDHATDYNSTLRFKTSNGNNAAATERMRITSAGFVGIGLASPSTKLHLYEASAAPVFTIEAAASGQSNYTRYRNTNSGGDVYVGMDGNGLFGFATGSLALGTVNTNMIFAPNYSTGEKMRIDTSGNVGIGTATVYTKLHVHGGNIGLEYGKAIVVSPHIAIASGGWPQGTNKLIETGWGTGDEVRFFTPGSQSSTQKMVINSYGNVGINKSSPSYKLDVNGSFAVTGGNIATFGSDGLLHINSRSTTYGSETVALQTVIDNRALTDSDPGVYGGQSRNVLALQPDGGYVGVGTTGPGDKFEVRGGAARFRGNGPGVHIQPAQTSGGGQNLFTGYRSGDSYGRAQLVLSSGYSDVIIASSQVNNQHGSNLSFVAYNPSNAGDYRKFVINQGNWGTRKQFLCFGYGDKSDTNPHGYINATDTVFTLDGVNKRVGIGTTEPTSCLEVRSSSTIPVLRGPNGNAIYQGGGYAVVNSSGFSETSSNYAWDGYPGIVRTSGNGEWRVHGQYSTYQVLIRADGGFGTFTGLHETFLPFDEDDKGMIVYSTGNYASELKDGNVDGVMYDYLTISDACPVVKICTTENDKRVMGVLSTRHQRTQIKEITEEEYELITGDEKYAYDKKDDSNVYVCDSNTGEFSRGYYNALGEGSIWVCNKNGNLENGDYITSSTVAGYGQKQNDDLLHNYTVAKITTDCDFSEIWVTTKKHKKTREGYTFNDNNEPVYENILDDAGNTRTHLKFKIRYLLPDATQISKSDYDTKLAAGEEVYKAAFVGCTYHCG